MKVVLQRVRQASVSVDGKNIAAIGAGLVVFAAIEKADTIDTVGNMADKVSKFRIFEDTQGKMNLSVIELKADILVVSQFTLAADCQKGTRPSFDKAEEPRKAEGLCSAFSGFLRGLGLNVKEGSFGAKMAVSLVNDGPVTIILGN
ncbi:MAG: D-aminoacyl-tRNA deacylase [Candidatus Omnitrophica bacterium]|nr:D-aminoacyl-tRNA deacylase [Candidatus Omnitrophota bacterium]